MLIIEDGSQVEGAESYISAVDCTTYHTNNGNALWTGTDAVKEAALRKATRYLDGHYRARWKGYKVSSLVQPLEWPRSNVEIPGGGVAGYAGFNNFLDSTTIPQRVKDACCELALRALSGELAADGSRNIKREKVDVLETEYFTGTVKGQTSYPVVDQLISDYIYPLGSQVVTR
jgi:hypothetical protein